MVNKPHQIWDLMQGAMGSVDVFTSFRAVFKQKRKNF